MLLWVRFLPLTSVARRFASPIYLLIKSGGPRGSITKVFCPKVREKGERRVDFLSSETDRITPAVRVSQHGAQARAREDVPHA